MWADVGKCGEDSNSGDGPEVKPRGDGMRIREEDGAWETGGQAFWDEASMREMGGRG